MSKYVIVGAGQVGSQLAERLAGAGDEVVLVSRSGSGPSAHGVRKEAADAVDSEQLIALTDGAAALFNCANPPYHRWPQEWPPLAESLLATAECTGAVLTILGNLYGYGPVDGPMTEDLPLAATTVKGRVRTKIWDDAFAAHEAGRARVVELRASDYFGPGAGELAHFGARMVPRVLAGKAAQYIGDPATPKSISYIPDVVDALVIAATEERAWGRAWHVPTNPATTAREFTKRVAELAGVQTPRISVTPHWMLRAAGLFSPLMRELEETRYQFVQPFVLDSSAFEDEFGTAPTPMDQALKETIDWWQR